MKKLEASIPVRSVEFANLCQVVIGDYPTLLTHNRVPNAFVIRRGVGIEIQRLAG
jgi:hypothetical protein